MQRKVKFESSGFTNELKDYSDKKFAVAKCCFLSSAENSHELDISEEVLRRDAHTMLGNFIVAKIFMNDATTHVDDEVIMGYFPKEQEVEFEEVGEGKNKIVKAWALAVISKRYAKDYYEMFSQDNFRKTSIEMTVETSEDDENKVLSFDAYGLTTLGKSIRPSCPDAEMSFVRFSADEAEKFFSENADGLTSLKKFVEERKHNMAEEKTYKVDKSKEAVSDKAWGEVDKTSLYKAVMEAKNKSSLVKDIYMLVEDGWEEAPSEKLKYPVMELKGDTFVYNREGLASALGYAKKENETSVVSKVEKIYKKLGLDSNGKEEDKKMAEIKFAAVDISDLWGKLYSALQAKYPEDDYGSVYRVDGIYEESNKKFAIIRHKDEDAKYRLDFSLTEEGFKLADQIIKVELEIKETDEIRKFAEPKNAEKYKKFEDEIEGRKPWAKVIKKVQDHVKGSYVDSVEKDHIIYTKDNVRYRVEADVKTDPDDKTVDAEIKWDTVKKDADQQMSECEPDDDDKHDDDVEMSADEMKAKMAQMAKDIEERDNIIMGKDKELEELRTFKQAVEDKEKAMSVEAIMAEVKDFVDAETYKDLREEGMACGKDEVAAFANKAKAMCFSAVKKGTKKSDLGIWQFAAPVQTKKKTSSIWD